MRPSIERLEWIVLAAGLAVLIAFMSWWAKAAPSLPSFSYEQLMEHYEHQDCYVCEKTR